LGTNLTQTLCRHMVMWQPQTKTTHPTIDFVHHNEENWSNG
jgi:hypothetical protein